MSTTGSTYKTESLDQWLDRTRDSRRLLRRESDLIADALRAIEADDPEHRVASVTWFRNPDGEISFVSIRKRRIRSY